MAIPTQLVNIPLGEGLGESGDKYHRDPPRADKVENATLRASGAVTKQPGWTSVASVVGVATEGARALVASDQNLLVTSQNGASVVSAADPGAFADQDSLGASFHNPVGIDSIPVASPRGQVLDIGVCYHAASDTYGVVWREWVDVANASDETVIGGGDIVALAMTSDSRVVAGPYRWDKDDSNIQGDRSLFLPRIETCTRSGSAQFNVTFLESGDATPGNVDGNTTHLIYVAGWSMGSVPTSTPAASLVGSSDRNSVCYDTHSVSTHDATYIVTVLAGAVNVFRVGSAVTSRTVGTSQGYQKPQIFHHDDTQTVVVTEAGNGTVWCLPENISADTSNTGLHAEDDPRLYRPSTITSAQLTYSGETMTIVGTNPGTITPTGITSLTVPDKCWDPQPWVGNAALFIAARQGEVVDPAEIQDYPALAVRSQDSNAEFWDATLEASVTHSDGVFRESFPILSSRLPPIVYEGVYRDPFRGVEEVGHVSQTCVDGAGRVVLGQAFSIASRKAYLIRKDTALPENLQDGGIPNQDRQIVLIRCSPNQADTPRSEIDHAGARIMAHGGLKIWDGKYIFDYVPQPKISAYIKDVAPGTRNTGILMAAFASVDAAASTTTFEDAVPESFARSLYPGSTGGTATTLCLMKAVLIYVDRNGTEWRSRPSPPIAIQNTALGNGLYFPRVEFELDSWAAQRILDNEKFDIELYVTPRTVSSGNGWVYETSITSQFDMGGTYYFCQRSPLLSDSDGFYVPDLYYIEQAGQTRYQATLPLYTSAGELAPYPPPSTGIVARSGNYAFLVPSEFPYEFWASKPLEAGRGPEFAPELTRNVPTDSGGIASLAGVGGQLFILCRNGVYAMPTSSGPDASGLGSFGALRLIHRGDGCVSHMLTVSTPHGVVYASENGIRIVGLDGMVQNIGEDCQDTLGDVSRFLRSVYDRAEDEVIFFATDGGLRLNLRTGAYSTFTKAENLLDAARPERSGQIYTLREDVNQIHVEDPSTGQDNGSGMDMHYESTWLTFEQTTGSFRGKKILALLRRLSGTGDIRVTVKYDYRDTVVDTFDFPFADVFSLSDPERSGHLRIHPSRQKFDAIKIGVQDTQYDGGQGTVPSDLLWTLAGISIEVGAKRGGVKLRSEQSSRT